MDSPPGVLQSELLTIKHTSDPATLFPQHAFGRGGVGHFLCTGQSRVGLQRLPQATSQPASLSVPARKRLGSSRSAGSCGEESAAGTSSLSGYSLISTDPVSIGATRAWEAGTVQHTHNFVASSRTVRPQDIPRASKWAAISYFENDPKQLARHMAVMDHVQARHDESMAAERQTEQARHNMWAEQQRETFRRQRLEQAARYARSGIRPRSAYADLGAQAAAEAAHAEAAAAAAEAAEGRDVSAGSRDPTQRFFSTDQVRTVLSTPGYAGPPLYPTHGGRMRPATAGVSSGRFYGMYGSNVLRSTSGSSNNLAGAAGMGTGGLVGTGGRTVIPLPKKTYVNVHERMAAEAAEAPAAKVAAREAAKARADEERTQATIAQELEELELFEANMRSLQRLRSRAARSQHQRVSGSGPSYGEDDRDDG